MKRHEEGSTLQVIIPRGDGLLNPQTDSIFGHRDKMKIDSDKIGVDVLPLVLD